VGTIIETGLALYQQRFGLSKPAPQQFYVLLSEDNLTATAVTPCTFEQGAELSAYGPVRSCS
jgi:hypothetical protein